MYSSYGPHCERRKNSQVEWSGSNYSENSDRWRSPVERTFDSVVGGGGGVLLVAVEPLEVAGVQRPRTHPGGSTPQIRTTRLRPLNRDSLGEVIGGGRPSP